MTPSEKDTISLQFSQVEGHFWAGGAIREAWESLRGNEEEFKARTGVSYTRAREIRDEVGSILDGSPRRSSSVFWDESDRVRTIQVTLPVAQWEVLCKAAEVTLVGLDEWEFHTRTGVEPEEAREFVSRLRAALAEAEKSKRP